MKTFRGQSWYTPREIARLGLIKNSTGGNNVNSNHYFVLKLIHSGRLKAKNYSIGKKRKFWLVSDAAINHYHNN